MNEIESNEIDGKKRIVSNLVFASGLVLTGVALIIMGVLEDSLGVAYASLIAPIILTAFFLINLIVSFLQRNTVALYIAGLCLANALIAVIGNFTEVGYDRIYPLFILSPGLASLFTLIMSKEYKLHLLLGAFFACTAGIFALQSCFDVSWAIIIPVFVLYLGAVAMLITIVRIIRSRKI